MRKEIKEIETNLKAIWDARLKTDPSPLNNVIIVDGREIEFINNLPAEGETASFRYQHRKMDHLHNLIITKKEKTMSEEKTMVDIDKLIKLRDQVNSAIKIEKSEKKKFEGDDVAHPALQYHLGRLHSLEEFKDKLNDLIIQG